MTAAAQPKRAWLGEAAVAGVHANRRVGCPGVGHHAPCSPRRRPGNQAGRRGESQGHIHGDSQKQKNIYARRLGKGDMGLEEGRQHGRVMATWACRRQVARACRAGLSSAQQVHGANSRRESISALTKSRHRREGLPSLSSHGKRTRPPTKVEPRQGICRIGASRCVAALWGIVSTQSTGSGRGWSSLRRCKTGPGSWSGAWKRVVLSRAPCATPLRSAPVPPC